MKPLRQDLSIFNKFKFEKPPVGVKFLFFRPEGIEQLAMDKALSFCEMLTEAQQMRRPFYFSQENHETCVGKILLGMEDMAPFAESGQIGDKVNFLIPEMVHGMKARELFSEGMILISIPYHWIPIITQNLKEMKWAPPAYTDGREKYLEREKRVFEELAQESQNP